MKPLARLWSVIRGDKYMVGAYPPPEVPSAPAPAAPDASPLVER
jgi:hypothetical protein